MLAPGCWILGIFATSSQVYGAHGCHLACLVPLLWRPGGPWDDPGTLEGTRKDPVRSRLGFYRFCNDLDQKKICSYLCPSSLSDDFRA